VSVDHDPFAPVDDPAGPTRAEPNAKRSPESDPYFATGEVGLSVKFGVGYEAPMFHVKASDVYILGALVGYDGPTDVSTRKYFGGLSDYWTNVARIIQGNYKDSRPDTQEAAHEIKPPSRGASTRSTPQARSGGARPQQRRAQDDDDTSWMYDEEVPPECDHGEWKTVTKVGAKGRWFAWGCPGTQGNQCSDGLQFVNKPR
jgi:hypothetical protein